MRKMYPMDIIRQKDCIDFVWSCNRSDVVEFLLISDLHLDSTKTDRAKIKRVLDNAHGRGAYVATYGDTLDLMQGKFDPRGGKSGVRPEYQVHNYYQAVIEDITEFLKPYDNLVFMSQGNHETGVIKRHEIDPLGMIAYNLRSLGRDVVLGDYEGWQRFRAKRATDSPKYSKTAFYTHGTGGSSPVTRGVIQTNRRQVNVHADIFISGHIHTTWAMPIPQRFLNQKGNEELREVLHIQLGTAKESHKDRNSWEAHKGFSAPSLGGYILKFYFDGDTFRVAEERVCF